jgi:murein DD-endopeptidase MepM/ murein hydrolase activator NlpD
MAVAVVIELRIAFAVLDANPEHRIVRLLDPFADHLIGPFQQLFTPADQRLAVAINGGLATVAYLAAGVAAARLTMRSGEIVDGPRFRAPARRGLARLPTTARPSSRHLAAGALVLVVGVVLWHVLAGAPAPRLREPFVSHRPPTQSVPGPRAASPSSIARTDARAAGNPLSPCRPEVTQGYGPTSMFGEPVIDGVRFHTGVDLACPEGTPVSSLTGGVAHVAVGWDEGFGTSVVVQTWTTLPGAHRPGVYFVRYAHLTDVDVRDGERVQVGQVVGHEGASGFATGPHLHFEVDAGNPNLTDSTNPACLLRL